MSPTVNEGGRSEGLSVASNHCDQQSSTECRLKLKVEDAAVLKRTLNVFLCEDTLEWL